MQSAACNLPLAIVALLIAVLSGLAGCHLHHNRHKPTVDELIQQAINASARHQAGDQEAMDRPSTTGPVIPAGAVIPFEAAVDEPGLQGELIPAPDNGTELLPAPAGQQSGLVNQDFIETDIREALLLMSQDAEVNIVVDEKVRGVVNVSVVDQPFDIALDKVLLPFGFVHARRGKQYFIGVPDPQSALFPHLAEQQYYKPKHLKTAELLDSVPPRFKPFVSVVGGNRLLIDAPPLYVEKVLSQFRKLDEPIPQVVLEAIVCVVAPDSGYRFGIDWSHSVEVNGANVLGAASTGLALSGTFTPAGVNNIFADFAVTTAFVKLLEENGYITIRAAPRVMAKDGEKANISIARETFFSVQPSTSQGANSVLFQNDIQKVESGITLSMTPRIRGNVVTVDIDRAEVSEDIRNVNTDQALNPFPVINRRSVSTTVHVENGKTIVIGGLVQHQVVDAVNQIPGLGNIPVLGKLFRNVERQEQEAEVVIFISPRIVTPGVVCEDELPLLPTEG